MGGYPCTTPPGRLAVGPDDRCAWKRGPIGTSFTEDDVRARAPTPHPIGMMRRRERRTSLFPMAMVRLIHHDAELAHWAAENLEFSDQYYVAGCWYRATSIQPAPRRAGHAGQGAVRY